MILDDILQSKRVELDRARSSVPESALHEREGYGEARRGFLHALREGPRPRIIAEIKRRSPSRGVIRERFDPAAHASAYDAAGASCISVLTDGPFFGGELAHLEAARRACSRPLLRKDFTIDPYQIVEARAWGADAVLLVVAALERQLLEELLACACAEGVDALVEVHDRAELDTAIAIGADLVGINNRNLKTFVTTIGVTRELAPTAPAGVTLVSESGLGDAAELAELGSLPGRGVDAFLIGETFMAAPDPGEALAALLRG
ncbi:MAG: indole-3-glycerol phosphate synthase TrpC [Candidatus Binatia bacterium]